MGGRSSRIVATAAAEPDPMSMRTNSPTRTPPVSALRGPQRPAAHWRLHAVGALWPIKAERHLCSGRQFT